MSVAGGSESRTPAVEAVDSVLHRVSVGGGRLAVREYYDPCDFDVRRAPLVLLHGFTGSSSSWAAIGARLAGRFRVLCPDLPGHGASTFEDMDAACTMDATVAVLSEVLSKLSIDSYALAGYSMGGRVALHAALEDATRISTLILESASPGISDDAERERRRTFDEELAAFLESSPIEAFVDRWEAVPVLASQRNLPVADRDCLRASRLKCSPAGLAASLRGMGTGAQAWLGGRLRQIHVPTLLVAGRDDEKFKKIAEFMDAHIPDSTKKIVESAGHSVHLEAPAEFAEAVAGFAATAANDTTTAGAMDR